MSATSLSLDPRPTASPDASADADATGASLTAVVYGSPGSAADAFQRAQDCGCAMAEAVARLRDAVAAHDLWILHEIDPQALLRRSGLAIGPARQILFFHPRYVARLLAADPTALGEAPLKAMLLEEPDGLTTVRWFDPALSFSRYGHPDLTVLGRELSALCTEVFSSAFGRAAPFDRIPEARDHDNART